MSQYNLPLPPPPRPAHAVLTKADLESSQTAYADVLTTAKAYRLALASLSTAASAFGSALESCARLKEARADALGPAAGASLSNSFNTKGTCTADALLTVAGLQHLVANHQQILSETVYRSFEVPLLHELDKWRAAVDDEEDGYARAVAAQSREIRRLEKEGLKLHRQRRRDVAKFRSHLVELTTKLDGLTVLHGEHARTLLRESQETSECIVDASCSLVRAEVDIFESLARKGWTGGGLEDVLEKGVDVFAAEDHHTSIGRVGGGGKGGSSGGSGGDGSGGGGNGGVGSGDGSKLFSILPPKSILADSGSETLRVGNHNRADSLLVDGDRYQSLVGAVGSGPGSDLPTPTGGGGGGGLRERDRDSDSVFSEFNRPRGVRPFSPHPQPLRLNPENLIGSLGNSDSSADSIDGRPPPTPGEGGSAIDDDDDDETNVGENHKADDDDDVTVGEPSPWLNEGLRSLSDAEEDQEEVGASLETPRQREDGSWSLAR